MANPLLDALGTASYALDTPGAYARGLLAGRPGERRSGREMLEDWGAVGENTPGLDWGDVGGFGVEAVVDPLSLITPAMTGFKALRGATRGAQALAHADDVNPLLRAAARFAGDESGAIDLERARQLMQTPDNPLGRMNALSRHAPARVSIDPVYQKGAYGALPEWDMETYAEYHADPADMFAWYNKKPEGFIPSTEPLVIPNLQLDEWGNDALMKALIQKHVDTGHWVGPSHVDQIPVHELGHAFHEQQKRGARAVSGIDYDQLPIADVDAIRWQRGGHLWEGISPRVRGDIKRGLSEYATQHPNEFIAESFAKQALGGGPLPPSLRNLYRDLLGPDLDSLPPGFWDTLRSFRPG